MKKTLIATALLSLTLAVPAFAADGAQATDTQSQAVVLFEQGSSLLLDNKHEAGWANRFTGEGFLP